MKKRAVWIVAGLVGVALFMLRKQESVTPSNKTVTTPDGTTFVPNTLRPIELPPHSPIYNAYYSTSPGIPDVRATFNIYNADLNYGYIPLFGLIPTPGVTH